MWHTTPCVRFVRHIEHRVAAGAEWEDGGFIFTAELRRAVNESNAPQMFVPASRGAGGPAALAVPRSPLCLRVFSGGKGREPTVVM